MHGRKQRCSFPYVPFLAAFILSCLYFLFHLHFMQQFLDWDQVWYTNNIKNMLEGSVPYYNPHHIHYETGGKVFHEFMVKNFGGAGFTDLPFNNRLRSLICACIGIFFTVLYLKEMTGKLIWGIIGGLMVAFCHGYLAYSTQTDTPIFPASAFCILCYCVKKVENAEQHPLVCAFIAGIICALGVVFHQYMAFACVVAVVSIFLPPVLFKSPGTGISFGIIKAGKESLLEKNPIIRYKAAVLMAFTGLVLIAGAYFYTGKTVFNLPFDKPDRRTAVGRYSYTTFQKWLFLYQDEGWWAGGFKKFDPRNSARGFTNAFLSPVTSYKYLRYGATTFHYDILHPGNENAFIYNQVAYVFLLPLAGILILFPFFWKRYKRGLFFLLVSYGLFIFFTAYWEPSYYEFWLIPCIISCYLAVLFLHFAGEKLKAIVKHSAQLPGYLLALLFILALSSHNVFYYVIPYSRYKHREDIDYKWKREYYMGLYSDPVYKYPDNPYKDVYTTKPVR